VKNFLHPCDPLRGRYSISENLQNEHFLSKTARKITVSIRSESLRPRGTPWELFCVTVHLLEIIIVIVREKTHPPASSLRKIIKIETCGFGNFTDLMNVDQTAYLLLPRGGSRMGWFFTENKCYYVYEIECDSNRALITFRDGAESHCGFSSIQTMILAAVFGKKCSF